MRDEWGCKKVLEKRYWNSKGKATNKASNMSLFSQFYIAASKYVLKVNDRNTKKKREICSNVTIKILERRHFYF